MTPEERLNRVERLMGLFVTEGRRLREESREWNERINMLIQCQMETTEQINRFSNASNALSKQIDRSSARHEREMADLRKSQKATDQALRAFIQESRQRRKRSDSES